MTDIAFCLVGGSGRFGREAYYCAKSIRQHYATADIFVAIPKSEYQEKPLPSDVQTVSLKFPIPDYPMSMKPLIVGETYKRSDASTICFLDSDTIVCRQLTLPPNGQIFALPEIYPNHHIGGSGESAWAPLYESAETELPQERIQSLFYNHEILPYYNAGVLVFRDINIGKEWLSIQHKLIDEVPNQTYTDQITFSILSTKYDTRQLSVNQHCPVDQFFVIPQDAEILHYWGPTHDLIRAPMQWAFLSEIGLCNEFERSILHPKTVSDYLSRLRHTAMSRIRYKLGLPPGWAD